MKAEFSVLRPEEIEMELTLKMPLGSWYELAKQLSINEEKYPANRLIAIINEMSFAATKHFQPIGKSDGG